jgi:hypothetical protein
VEVILENPLTPHPSPPLETWGKKNLGMWLWKPHYPSNFKKKTKKIKSNRWGSDLFFLFPKLNKISDQFFKLFFLNL